MGCGNFLSKMKANPAIIEGFTLFLTEELVNQAVKLNKFEKNGSSTNDEVDDNNQEDDHEEDSLNLGQNDSLKNLLVNLGKLKENCGKQDSNFDIDNFVKEQQEQIADVLINRHAKANKAAEEALKREQEQEELRRAAAEARELERQKREQSKIE